MALYSEPIETSLPTLDGLAEKPTGTNYFIWTWAAAAVCWIVARDVKHGQVTALDPSASRASGALTAVSHVAFGVMTGIAVAGGSLLAPIALAMVPAVLAHAAAGPGDTQSAARPRDHSRAG